MIARASRRMVWAAVGALALLAGCGDSQDELQGWMAQERAQARPQVQPISPPQRFNPQPYEVGAGVPPFDAQKLTVVLRQEETQPNSAVAAELNRRKEPLEAFPLDSMTMVGSVARKGVPHALLKVDNLLYQVKVGDHIGQNYGKIMKVTETEIELRELVRDASGEWVERPAVLQLQEGA